MPLLKGLKALRRVTPWKYRSMTKYRGIQTWDVEDLKGGREIPEIWGKIIVCSKVFVCICKLGIYVMSDLAKICRAWSCWTHLIKTKAHISFIEGVNIYIYTSKFT